MNLKRETIQGVVWTFFDVVVNRGSYFVATLVLANILGPEEFGLLGMITLFISISNSLIDTGMSTSLLRSNNLSDVDYSTVFISNFILSVIIYVILYFSAPSISHFYSQPILCDIIRWYSIGIVINSLRLVYSVKLMKELQFKKLTFLNIPGNILSVIIGIWMGYNDFGIWSLVGLFLSNQIISTIVFWVFSERNFGWEFDKERYKIHFGFGYKLLLSSQLNVIVDNLNNILIGRFYNVRTLGYYERAYTLNNYPVSVLSGIILKVAIPSLTLIKDDAVRFQKVFRKMIQSAFLVSSFGLGLFVCLSEQIIEIVLGQKWLPALPIFRILALCYVFYPIHSLNINLLSIVGRSDLFLKIEVIKQLGLIIIIYVCFSFGVIGLVWGSVVHSVISLLINTHFSGRFLNYKTSAQLKDLLPSLLVVLFCVASIFLVDPFLTTYSAAFQLFLKFIAYLMLFLSFGELLRFESYIQIKKLIISKKQI